MYIYICNLAIYIIPEVQDEDNKQDALKIRRLHTLVA